MARTGVLPNIASLWTSESPEARQLADALRHGRLTLLCGERDDLRAGLIISGVLPLLRRRTIDSAILAPRGASAVILPFPERRSLNRARLAELVVFHDAWDDASPAGVHRAIDDALQLTGVTPERKAPSLAGRVRAIGDRHGARMLFVFDRFDGLLDQCSNSAAASLMLDELVCLLNQPLQANVLISMRADESTLLEHLGARGLTMRGKLFAMSPFDTASADEPASMLEEGMSAMSASPGQNMRHWLALAGAPAPPGRPGSDMETGAAVPASTTARRHEGDRLLARAEIYADIATFVGRSDKRGKSTDVDPAGSARLADCLPAVQARPDRVQRATPGAPVNALSSGLTLNRRPVPFDGLAVLMSPQLAVTGAAPMTRLSQRLPLAVTVLAMLALTVALLVLPNGQHEDARADALGLLPMAASPHADRAGPPTTPSTLAALDIAVESENKGTVPALAAELVAAVSSNAGVKATAVTALSPVASVAPVSIVRYDALQDTALRGDSPPIRVIAPLYTEEVYVVVRADSPLQHLHQLRGRRINVGPEGGARALTALALYERMFGKPLPAAQRDRLDAATALQRLAERPSFDAVVLVQPEPDPLWGSLPPQTRGALRLLSLAPNHPASRRALQAYLPATLHAQAAPSAAPVPTLAAMAFLVANGNPDAAQREAIVALTRSLCRTLPALKRDGHPKWGEVRPGQQFETPWLPETSAAAAWSDCAAKADLPFPSSQPQGASR